MDSPSASLEEHGETARRSASLEAERLMGENGHSNVTTGDTSNQYFEADRKRTDANRAALAAKMGMAMGVEEEGGEEDSGPDDGQAAFLAAHGFGDQGDDAKTNKKEEVMAAAVSPPAGAPTLKEDTGDSEQAAQANAAWSVGRQDISGDTGAAVVALLTTTYLEHNPEKLVNIPRIVREYDGNWELLFTGLYEKYGIEGPIPRFDEHGNNRIDEPEGEAGRGGVPSVKEARYMLVISKDTQHVIGMDDHHHGREMTAHLGVHHITTDEANGGKVTMYFAKEALYNAAMAWVVATKKACQIAREEKEREDQFARDEQEREDVDHRSVKERMGLTREMLVSFYATHDERKVDHVDMILDHPDLPLDLIHSTCMERYGKSPLPPHAVRALDTGAGGSEGNAGDGGDGGDRGRDAGGDGGDGDDGDDGEKLAGRRMSTMIGVNVDAHGRRDPPMISAPPSTPAAFAGKRVVDMDVDDDAPISLYSASTTHTPEGPAGKTLRPSTMPASSNISNMSTSEYQASLKNAASSAAAAAASTSRSDDGPPPAFGGVRDNINVLEHEGGRGAGGEEDGDDGDTRGDVAAAAAGGLSALPFVPFETMPFSEKQAAVAATMRPSAASDPPAAGGSAPILGGGGALERLRSRLEKKKQAGQEQPPTASSASSSLPPAGGDFDRPRGPQGRRKPHKQHAAIPLPPGPPPSGPESPHTPDYNLDAHLVQTTTTWHENTKPDAAFRVKFTAGTAHLLGIQGHAHAVDMMRVFGATNGRTDANTGNIHVSIKDENQWRRAAEWVRENKGTQLRQHLKKQCPHPYCAGILAHAEEVTRQEEAEQMRKDQAAGRRPSQLPATGPRGRRRVSTTAMAAAMANALGGESNSFEAMGAIGEDAENDDGDADSDPNAID
jgi:hypothetical protein